MRGALCVFVFTLFCAISLGISAPQTKPWRIAISGGQAVTALGGNVPGYLSILALHGLPRMRLDESELTNLKRLRQFDVVIACWGKYGREPALRTLEQFAQEGGDRCARGLAASGRTCAARQTPGARALSKCAICALSEPDFVRIA